LEKQQNKILLDKEEEWRIKSRAIWLKSGDENTRFFHNFAKGRKSANTIWRLKDEEGREVSSFPELSGLGKDIFRIFLQIRERLLLQKSLELCKVFLDSLRKMKQKIFNPGTKEEVEAAMKLMGKDKSPGPDGWTIELFLHFFDQIGTEITEVVEESRQKGEVYRPFNSTFIALIPRRMIRKVLKTSDQYHCVIAFTRLLQRLLLSE
jgi:hypothetical protein